MASSSQPDDVSVGTQTEMAPVPYGENHDPIHQGLQRIQDEVDRIVANIQSCIDQFEPLKENQGGPEMRDDGENEDDSDNIINLGGSEEQIDGSDSEHDENKDSIELHPTEVGSAFGTLLRHEMGRSTEEFEEPSEAQNGFDVRVLEETPRRYDHFDPWVVINGLLEEGIRPLIIAQGLLSVRNRGLCSAEQLALLLRCLRERLVISNGDGDDNENGGIEHGASEDDENEDGDNENDKNENDNNENDNNKDDDNDNDDDGGGDDDGDGDGDYGGDANDSEDDGNDNDVEEDEDQDEEDKEDWEAVQEECGNSDHFTQAPTQPIAHQGAVANSTTATLTHREINVSNMDYPKNVDCRDWRAHTIFVLPRISINGILRGLYYFSMEVFLFALCNRVATLLLQTWNILNPGPWQTMAFSSEALWSSILIYFLLHIILYRWGLWGWWIHCEGKVRAQEPKELDYPSAGSQLDLERENAGSGPEAI